MRMRNNGKRGDFVSLVSEEDFQFQSRKEEEEENWYGVRKRERQKRTNLPLRRLRVGLEGIKKENNTKEGEGEKGA